MPTFKQQIAFKKLSENIRKTGKKPLNIGSALRAAGYSESVCNSPQRVTETKGWNELFENFFPDELIIQKHKALLESENTDAVIKALDMLYKLRGLYKTKIVTVSTTKYDQMTDEELDIEYNRLRQELHLDL